MYCAEYSGSFLPSVGHQVILNESTLREMAQELGQDGDYFVAKISDEIDYLNRTYGANYVELPSEDLKPLNEVLGKPIQPIFGQMNFVDICWSFLYNVVPREQESDAIAVAQAVALYQLKKRILGLEPFRIRLKDPLSSDPGRTVGDAFNEWFDKLLQVVGSKHTAGKMSYNRKLRPLIKKGSNYVPDITFISTSHLMRLDDVKVGRVRSWAPHRQPLLPVKIEIICFRPNALRMKDEE